MSVRFCSRFVLPLAVPAAIVAAQAANVPPAAQARSTIDSLAKQFMAENSTPGTAIAVIRGTDTLLFRGFGMANLETSTPVSAQTVFRIGSVTKQFTAAAVLQLAEQGKLALADTIGRWLPNLPRTWRGVTVTQLLNHTSGIPSYTDLGDPWIKRWGEEMTGEQILALTARRPLDFARGAKWKYNNTGYVLLGMLVEARGGAAWGEAFGTRFFAPLGLSHTRYCDNGPVIANRASGYARDRTNRWVNATYLAMSQPHAAGAMCSTIGDIVTWNRALHTGRVVSAASYAAMITPVGSARGENYGFGIGHAQFHGHDMLSHSGGINGFLTDNLYFPGSDLSVTVLTNGEAVGPGRFARQLARAALGVPLDRGLAAVAVPAQQLSRYEGTYTLTLGAPQPFTVFLRADSLFGELQGQSPTHLIPLGNHVFGANFDPSVRITFAMDADKPKAFTLLQNGREMVAPRRQ